MMALSRVGFLTSRVCSNGVLLNLYSSSLHQSCYYKVLSCPPRKSAVTHLYQRLQSSDAGKPQPATSTEKQSQRARLKQTVRDYGATIVVFHIAISLASLGLCYLAVSNGVDAVKILQKIGFSESVVSNQLAVGGSTFVMAYAVHKLLVPVRMGITLSAAPFIVRYLRRINVLKPPVQKG